MKHYPRITSVTAVDNTRLRVCFDTGVTTMYDCRPIIASPRFRLLAVPAFFRAVRVDTGGYGVCWTDQMDLSEYELWTNGQEAASGSVPPDDRPPREPVGS